MADAAPEPSTFTFVDDGHVPNSTLPLLLYRGAIAFRSSDHAGELEQLFAANGWVDSWRDGIYDYHHYHSTAHEVLGVAWGMATVRFGGEAGEDIRLEEGDVVVLPAGTGHCRIAASPDFEVVGAYPRGQTWDLIRAGEHERPEAVLRIGQVPIPDADPVRGSEGGVTSAWRAPA